MNETIDPQHQFPVSIESIGDCLNRLNIKLVCSLNSEIGKTTIKDAGELTALVKKEKRNMKSLTEFKR